MEAVNTLVFKSGDGLQLPKSLEVNTGSAEGDRRVE